MFKPDLFNLDLLILTKAMVSRMKEVTALNIYEPSTTNFDPAGLFSVEIFGQVGSEARNTSYGYINTYVPLMHPEIFKHVISLKAFYNDILSGKSYAVWDDKEKDFIPGNIENGRTGYAFFIEHFDDIVFKTTGSESRDYKIKLIDKSGRSKGLMNYVIVEPAGLRDYTIDSKGQPSEDEINEFYRRILMNANMLANLNITPATIESVDQIRFKMQTIFLELYEYIIGLLQGKSKFIQGKWAKRAIRGGTRNVITSIPTKISDFRDKDKIVSFNNTTVGLFQYTKALDVVAYHHITNMFSHAVFKQGSNTATLIDMKSMKSIAVDIGTKTYDAWMSEDGINDMINSMAQEDMRSTPVILENKYYLALLYDDGKNIMVITNTDNLPDDLDMSKTRPITYFEMIYIAVARTVGKYPALLTRYPIAGLGGIYPTTPYLKVTLRSRKVTLIDANFEPIDTLPEFPIMTEKYYNSLSPHYSKLARLGGDHDGDKVSFTLLFSDEAIKEVRTLMNKREFYITPDGHITYSVATKDLDIVFKIMSK